MKVVILGGGPAGLAAADEISANSDNQFVIFEKMPQVGGLAQTLAWDAESFFDLGPHKIFSTDKALMKRVLNLLPQSSWLERPKASSIFLNGFYLPYPPSPFSLLKVFGPAHFAKILADYGIARVKSIFGSSAPSTFEDDLVQRLGRQLYEALFKPIALKLWGDPKNLDVKLSKGRVQTPSLAEVLGRLLKIKKTSEFEALTFQYPRGGLQNIWQAIVEKSSGQGEFLLNHEVVSIKTLGKSVKNITIKDHNSGLERNINVGESDFVFSTLPLYDLPRLMGHEFSNCLAQKIQSVIKFNDLSLVFFKIDKENLLEDSWIFVPDPDIIFHRLSEQESFDPSMTPNGSIVCCEIMKNETKDINSCSDRELVEKALSDLKKMGFSGFKVLETKVIHLPPSYPVYLPGHEQVLDEILREMDSFENFKTLGRLGAFNYIGTLDAMDIGYGAAQWLLSGDEGGRRRSWHQERLRTLHYPVLD